MLSSGPGAKFYCIFGVGGCFVHVHGEEGREGWWQLSGL